MTISIHPIKTLKDNYVWTMINEENKTAVIVDPGEAAPVLNFLEQEKLDLRAILITHHHWDHTNGIADILNHNNVPVYGPADEPITHLSHPLHENDVVRITGFPDFRVLSIPAHTAGHIAYYGDNILFCGDTLFACGCGRLFEGTADQMYHSLQKMAALPDDTRVYCAHEYTLTNLRFAATLEPDNKHIQNRLQQVKILREKNLCTLPSTIQIEKETNPFLRCSREEFAEIRTQKDHFNT